MSYIPNKKSVTLQSGFKVAQRYTYKTANKQINVFDKDLEHIVSVFNKSINQYLYIAGDPSYQGDIEGNCIFYDNSPSGTADGDELYIVYLPKEGEDIANLLNQLIEQQKETNKILKKIYNPI